MEPTPETEKAFAELARYGGIGLLDLVLDMGRQAKRIVPQCVGLSLGLFEEGLTFTLQASTDEIAALDAIQYLDGGPCVDAAHNNETIQATLEDAIDEDRWHMFARASSAAGVASSLTLPLLRAGRVVGA